MKGEGSMRRFSGCVFAGIFLLCTLPLSAFTVSFIIAEAGLPQGAFRPEASNRWETAFMDTFFEAGHIVSNAPVKRLASAEGEFPRECRQELEEARAGGVEYLVLVILEYQASTTGAGPAVFRPGGATMKLYRVNPYRFLAEERHPPAGQRLTSQDENANARTAARMILSHVERNRR
jgi:hypothetical protein